MDVVFAGEIIEHLVDTDRFLQQIRDALKPGGALILTTPNLLNLENRIRMFLGFYPRWVDWSLTSSGLGHVRAYTFATLRKQLTETGFQVESMRGNYVPLVRNQCCFLDDRVHHWIRFTGSMFPTLSGTIIVKARKPAETARSTAG